MKKKVGIYMITNITNGNRYIGSSRNILKRWSTHKYDAKRRSLPLYDDIREFGLDQFEFIILEECTVDELKVREQYYIDKLHPEYNIRTANAGISVSFSEDAKAYNKEYCRQYRQSHKEAISERYRKWYEANKDDEKERSREYYQANKDKINERSHEYRQSHKEAISEYNRNYYEANKSELNEYQRRYYQANKDKIKERRRKKYKENKLKEAK